MQLKAQISYKTPEGLFTGTIHDARLLKQFKNGEEIENLRITVALDPLPEQPDNDFRVRVDYYDNQSKLLYGDLVSLVGREVKELVDDKQKIIDDRLSLLHGKRVQVNVTHEYRPGHDQPFRKAKIVRPNQLMKKAA
jgi:hypothetical protein